MNMAQMFKEIEHYHKVLGYDFDNVSDEKRIKGIRQACLALNQEVAELTDSFPWKPWRKTEDQPWDNVNATEEIVDILFFLGQIMEAAYIKPIDIERKFHEKLRENYDRIERGYNNRSEERG